MRQRKRQRRWRCRQTHGILRASGAAGRLPRALLRLTFFFLSPATVLVVFLAGFFSAAVLVAFGGAMAGELTRVWRGRRFRNVRFERLGPLASQARIAAEAACPRAWGGAWRANQSGPTGSQSANRRRQGRNAQAARTAGRQHAGRTEASLRFLLPQPLLSLSNHVWPRQGAASAAALPSAAAARVGAALFSTQRLRR